MTTGPVLDGPCRHPHAYARRGTFPHALVDGTLRDVLQPGETCRICGETADQPALPALPVKVPHRVVEESRP